MRACQSSGTWFATSFIVLCGALNTADLGPASGVSKLGADAAMRIQIVDSRGTTEGTCALVHKERRERDVAYYFLTASHLFDAGLLRESRATTLRIRVIVNGSRVIETGGSSATFPGGAELGLGLALVKAISTDTSLVSTPITLIPPDAGAIFVIQHLQRDGSTGGLTERVRFRSTRLVIGDRSVQLANGLLGSPAAVEGRVFGIVSEIGARNVPVVALLSGARGFLARAIPGWDSHPG